jgi:hypothetical protein
VEEKYKKENDKWILMVDDEGWFEIFSTGTHTDSNGHIADWSEKDLDEIVSLYNPAVHEAPIVIGHPEMDSPAYGWIDALKREGDKLLAKPKQLVEEFKEWVRKGFYKKVSIALFPDLGLRHVGFLGGTPPAVKGLKPAAFGDQKAKWIIESDLKFMELWQQETVRSIFQRLRDWIIDKFGLEEADKVIQSWDLDSLKPEPAKSGLATAPSFTEKTNKGGKDMEKFKEFLNGLKTLIVGAEKDLPADSPGSKFTEIDLAAAEKRGKDLAFAEAQKQVEVEIKAKEEAQKKLKEIETQKRKDGIASFCEAQIKEGKFTPALRKIIEPLMIFAATHEEPIEFAEGEKKPPIEILKLFLKAVPKLVEFSEIAGDGKTKIVPKDFDTAVDAVMAEKKISKGKAIAFCAKEYPELHQEYIVNLKK